MCGSRLLMLGVLLLALGCEGQVAPPATPEPQRIIFDTDMGNDVDDVMALALIHALEQQNVCQLIAVTVTKDHPLAVAFVDALNTFYGRPDLPVGAVRDGATREKGKFLGLATQRDGDHLRYPNDLTGDQAPEAVRLIRKTLADQPDNSVVLIQVGFFTNFARLLESAPDAFSPLTGKALIKKKVTRLSIMAGEFRPGERPEYNVLKDIHAAQKMAKQWPTPIVWSGFDIGQTITYPHQSIEQDYNYIEHHPVKEAYVLYQPPPHDRPTWDLTAVLAAVLPDQDYFTLSPPGRVRVLDSGETQFQPAPRGRDRVLKTDPARTARVRELFVQRCSAPPPSPLQTTP